MCTLICSYRQFPGLPLVVAANRDERLDRASSPIELWRGERFIAPKDDALGGTWLGLTDRGMFVGVTNRFGAPRDLSRESRGTLLLEALRSGSARAVHEKLEGLSPRRFNAFHLLYADASDAFVTWSDGDILRRDVLSPGTHIVTERSLGGDDKARSERVRELLGRLQGPPTPEPLMELLREHGKTHPLEGTCVHVPELGYGTRSSLVLIVPADLAKSRLFWAEGNPCTADFRERADLVAKLLTVPTAGPAE